MGGGLMQLVAYGAQDIYLTGNPQITFFKVVYRRHTNFSMEAIEQTFSGTASFGGKVTSTVSRNGDLVGRMYVEMNPAEIFGNENAIAPNPCHNLLKEMELEIGGQRIDKHYSHWLNVWTELTEELVPAATVLGTFQAGWDQVVSTANNTPVSAYQRMALAVKCGTTAIAETYASVPLQFWFCRNPGLALPLIALQYHEVKVTITFETAARLAGSSPSGSLSSVKLFADYIYLDTDERRRFAQQSHEYLIEQLQYQKEAAGSTFNLNFNHPVKELIWAGAKETGVNQHGSPNNPYDMCITGSLKLATQPTVTATIKLNGHERFSPRRDGYFTRTQPWQHHSNSGGGMKQDAVHVYSFALKPEEHQPSGTCNFSRIDTAQLVYSQTVGGSGITSGIHIYAVNYNVLRIMSGMGGLAYSN